jgi:hypothetical protein
VLAVRNKLTESSTVSFCRGAVGMVVPLFGVALFFFSSGSGGRFDGRAHAGVASLV